MRKGRFSEEQIMAILREQEAGMATTEVCRRHGISSATFYAWKSKYGGLEQFVVLGLFPRSETQSGLPAASCRLESLECLARQFAA